MSPVRVGAVPYLNARPILAGLLSASGEGPAEDSPEPFRIHFAPPGRLAEMLVAGALDIALVPSIEYYRAGGLLLLPDVSISSAGPAESVALFLRGTGRTGPPGRSSRIEEVLGTKRLGADPASRASIALAQILVAEMTRKIPETVPIPPEADPRAFAEAERLDGFVLIGDRALGYAAEGWERLDLGAAWWRFARLPFVFAVWAARADARLGPVETRLRLAKFEGRRRLPEIAREEALRRGLDRRRVLTYLRDRLVYDLSTREIGGMEAFYRYAVKWGLAPEGRRIEFLGRR